MQVDREFWHDRRVLVTGHTGFKGGWLCTWLKSMGAVVAGLSLPPSSTGPSLFEVAGVAEDMVSELGDIRDAKKVHKVVSQFAPEIVIHMAAQALVRQSYVDPVETYATNVMGTVHVLDAVRTVKSVKAVVNVTTDKCYENNEWVWGYRENEPMGGHDPYSSSKGCSELVSSAFRRSYLDELGIALATARAGNVIGGGDWSKDRLVPDVLHALDQNEPVSVRNPNATRPWQHVLEPLSGYLILAQALIGEPRKYASAWNFGPVDEDAKPVEWLVQRMCTIWGDGATWQVQGEQEQKVHEAHYLKLDASKARHYLGWAPAWRLEEALAETIKWHRAWRAGVDCRALMLEQINKYTRVQ